MYILDYYMNDETVQVTVHMPTQHACYHELAEKNWEHYYIEDSRGNVIDEAHCEDKELKRWR